jgi:hypothetical protein
VRSAARQRCAADTGPDEGGREGPSAERGPGSAPHHCVLRRVRDDGWFCTPRSIPSSRAQRSAQRCAADTGPDEAWRTGPAAERGPGPALRHCMPQRVRDDGLSDTRWGASGMTVGFARRDQSRHPVRSAARSGALQTRDLVRGGRGPAAERGPGPALRHCMPQRVRDDGLSDTAATRAHSRHRVRSAAAVRCRHGIW